MSNSDPTVFAEREPGRFVSHVGWPREDDLGHDTADGKRGRDWVPITEPANAVTSKARMWRGREVPAWTFDAPATTVASSARNHPPGHKLNADDIAAGRLHYAERRGPDAVRLTPAEAAALQDFPPDYRFEGTRTMQFKLIGNAVPARMAELLALGLRVDARV